MKKKIVEIIVVIGFAFVFMIPILMMKKFHIMLQFIFSTFITLIFCTIFADQSTQVEVIQYIKEE